MRQRTWMGTIPWLLVFPLGCDGSSETGSAPNGNASAPDGNVSAPDGNVSAPDGNVSAPDGNVSAPDVGGFCRLWLDAFASYMQGCGCAATAIQHYRDQNAALCDPSGFFAAVTDAIAAGNVIYHPEAVNGLFSRLEDGSPLCVEEPFRALKLDSSELFSFAGVFTGTHELGAPCTLPVSYKGGFNDCREGVCARNASGTGGVCIALVGVGDACDASGVYNLVSTTKRLCVDRRIADDDGEYASAFDSLSCVPTGTGVCARDLTDGQPCLSDEACRSGRCVGTGVVHEAYCAARLTDGEVCTGNTDCSSGACRTGTPSVCGALLADGEPCGSTDEACASGSCNGPGSGVCRPPPSKSIGEACSSPYECISSGHGGSRDKVCAGGTCIADICANYL